MKDSETNRVAAGRMDETDATALQGFVRAHVEPGATLYTDETKAYAVMPEFMHEAVNHSAKEFVCGMASTNGMESFWSMLKRGYRGIYHKSTEKHVDRFVAEFAARYNIRNANTVDMMGTVAHDSVGCRRHCRDLLANNGLPSRARAAA